MNGPIRDDAPETLVEQDICIACGAGMEKPAVVQLNSLMAFQPRSLCPVCEEAWRWREQICVKQPFQSPLWRPRR